MDSIRRPRLAWIALVTLLPLAGAAAQEVGRLHHVHLNVADVDRSVGFYQQTFGAIPIRYNERVPALLLERNFIFLTRHEPGAIADHQRTGLTHMSWSTRNGPSAFEWLKSRGVTFHTPIQELLPGSTYMYAYGPDREVIEVVDVPGHHRFNHLHLIAEDDAAAGATAEWFRALLHHPGPVTPGPMRNHNLSLDGVAFTVFPIGARLTPPENDGTLRPTEGTQLDHLAF